MPRLCTFFAISLMLSRHTRDHPLRRLWIGLFINHVRGIKGGLWAYWRTNNSLSIIESIGRIIKIGALRDKIDSMQIASLFEPDIIDYHKYFLSARIFAPVCFRLIQARNHGFIGNMYFLCRLQYKILNDKWVLIAQNFKYLTIVLY